MSKIIKFDTESRSKLKAGVDMLANSVKVTLGPKGRTVIIGKKGKSPIITKDGVTVAKAIELDDEIENMGAQLVKDVASKTNDLAGDGTTTATVLAQKIFNDGIKMIEAGANPMDLKHGIDLATMIIIDTLKEKSKPIKSNKSIKQIATISANNDSSIGNMIADAMERVGKDGVITVEEGQGVEMEVDTVEGMQFDKGYISPYFVTDQDTLETVLDNPYILLVDTQISSMKNLLNILEAVAEEDKALLIISDDVSGEALSTLIVNKLRGQLKIAAVKTPGFGLKRKHHLEDIAIITGGSIVKTEIGEKLEEMTIDKLGKCKKIIIDKSTTTIINGSGSSKDIKDRIVQIKNLIENGKSDYEIEQLQERLAKLAGGVAVIKIGATTELEMKEKKDRVDDALHATRAAVEEGISIGGGLALIEAVSSLEKAVVENRDQQLGVEIIEKAIFEPFNIIISNGGKTPEVILNNIKNNKLNGYNARTDKHVDMIQDGIIDPTKVTRLALTHASSIAGLLLTTDVSIVDKKEKSIIPTLNIPM